MEITRTTDILLETKRRFVIRQPQSNEQLLCGQCAGQMIPAEAAAVLFKISRRVIYQRIEEEIIHFNETETGVIFVCPNSFAEVLTDSHK